MFAYSNSGQSMRAIDTGMEEAGETVFDHYATDVQVARSYESGIVLPDTWKTYRAALRVIVSTGAGTIPALPAWPS